MSEFESTSAVELVFLECERARAAGHLITKVSAKDKEYHFQNWVQARLDACALNYDEPGRNTYPDFRLVDYPEGTEVKGLAWPGREADYDSNSQVPTGTHNGRTIYYIFGRYPSDADGVQEYPVTDLVMCHGDFLNSMKDYVHKNKSFRGFGSYGDILVRDRKMYVVPTPFALADGTAGLVTLIVPETFKCQSEDLVKVGEITRVEVDNIVVSYEFNLQSNDMLTHMAPNPHAGQEHCFAAYRVRGRGDNKAVNLMDKAATTDLPDESVDLVITDPPYMDNVHYAELADFFHAWLRRMRPYAGYPDIETTRSEGEVQQADAAEFGKMIQAVWVECARVLKPEGLVAFTFHQARISGWVELIMSLRASGLRVTSIQPVKGEMTTSIVKAGAREPSNLDSVVVCRKVESLGDYCHISMLEQYEHAISSLSRLIAGGVTVGAGDIRSVVRGTLLAYLASTTENLHQECARVDEFADRAIASLLQA